MPRDSSVLIPVTGSGVVSCLASQDQTWPGVSGWDEEGP